MRELTERLRLSEHKYSNLKAKQESIKEDFKFNLELLRERDTELSKYDAIFNDYNTALSVKDEQIHTLSASLNNAKQRMRVLRRDLDECRAQCNKVQTENDYLKSKHRNATQQHSQDLRRLKESHAAQLQCTHKEHEQRLQSTIHSHTLQCNELRNNKDMEIRKYQERIRSCKEEVALRTQELHNAQFETQQLQRTVTRLKQQKQEMMHEFKLKFDGFVQCIEKSEKEQSG